MKSGYLLAPIAVAIVMAVSSPVASAQPYAPPPPHRYEAVTYGYATVLRATPAYESYQTVEQHCDDNGGYQRAHRDTTGGTIVGALIGGALGNTVGKGDGRKAATIAGAVAGGAIGHNVAKNGDPDYVPDCRMVDVQRDGQRPAGFDVEYNYKGDVYVARMPYDPGDRLRVRVSVVPADGPPPYRR